MSLRARTSLLDEWVKEKGSEKEWFWWSEILMGIPGGEAFGFVVVALCLLADQTVIQAVWSLVVWGRLVPRLCSCELWTCTLSHLLDQWDTPLAAATVLIVVHCHLHVPFRAFSTTNVPRGEVQSVKTRHLTQWGQEGKGIICSLVAIKIVETMPIMSLQDRSNPWTFWFPPRPLIFVTTCVCVEVGGHLDEQIQRLALPSNANCYWKAR